MRKVNIANYVIYDLSNRFHGPHSTEIDRDIVDLVADKWHKKHFISATHGIKQHHTDHIGQKFIM